MHSLRRPLFFSPPISIYLVYGEASMGHSQTKRQDLRGQNKEDEKPIVRCRGRQEERKDVGILGGQNLEKGGRNFRKTEERTLSLVIHKFFFVFAMYSK